LNQSEITDQLKKGNQSAMAELIDETGGQIINLCYNFVHNKQDAEDIAQEVFIEVWHSINKFNGKSKLTTWIYRIASNRSIDFLRKNKKHLSDIDISKAEFRLSEDSNPQLSMEEREMGQILLKAIDQLPDNQKKALVLSKFEEKSYKEISEILKKSVSSVESLIFRANSNLKKIILKDYPQ
jgi:RNA polymerase sigma-70 factor (ECF subfamily)